MSASHDKIVKKIRCSYFSHEKTMLYSFAVTRGFLFIYYFFAQITFLSPYKQRLSFFLKTSDLVQLTF